MEQSPADARAAPFRPLGRPTWSRKTDMLTETPPSPKRPRDPPSGNKVSQRATTFDPVWPESQFVTSGNRKPVHSTPPTHARASHIPPPLWVGGSSL
eukprot:scaffold10093_cov104-Isochrysis_galbana.AAC.4